MTFVSAPSRPLLVGIALAALACAWLATPARALVQDAAPAEDPLEAEDGPEQVTPRERTCQQVLDAFATGDVDALRDVLAARDVQLTLPALEEERLRAVDGRYGADQAALVLSERLVREQPPAAPDLGPDALTSADGTMCARCPIFDPEKGSVFVVLHYGLAASNSASSASGSGRLYLDLHLDSSSSRWQVRAVRELR